MIPQTGRFPRSARIRATREYRELDRRGRRQAGRSFVLLARSPASGLDTARLGATVSRRVGSAVVRNRVKRRIREWFRRYGRPVAGARDLVVIARSTAAGLGSAETFAELDALLEASR